MSFDYFIIAVTNLRKRKLRAWLTVIGIFIGIMSVVALISLSRGMENAILSEFKKLGTDRILITPGGAEMGPVGGLMSPAKFTESDYDVVKKIKGIEQSASVYAESATIKFGKEQKNQLIFGFPFDNEHHNFYKTQSMFEIEYGRLLRSGDKYKAMIGWGIANDFFDKKVRVGNKIFINDQEFIVVGIHAKKGGLAGDNSIRIPKETAREIFDEPNEVTTMFVKVEQSYNVNDMADNIKRKLRKFRHVKENEEDFTIQTTEQAIKIFEQVLGAVQAVLVGIALISLLVGAIGIMNTMYTSVVERTREIGIMKAVGAKNSTILSIFLIESGLLGLVGGTIGIFLGLSISKSAELIATQFGIDTLQAYTGLPLILGALGFSFIVGSISGVFPAKQASKLQPTDALRK